MPRARKANGSNGKPRSDVALNLVEELRPHSCAELVPRLPAAEAAALQADISARGVLKPLEINPDGVVLDGHERLRIARELGLRYVPARIVEAADERSHILREALLRKHLNPGQRALLALELDEIEQQRAQARVLQRANLKQNAEVANLPPRGERTRERVSELTGASPRTVQDAETVRGGNPALCAQVRQGTIAVSKAARIVRREHRYAEIGAAPPLPTGQFELIYADPPWQLGNPDSEYAPENHYPTMPLDDIKAIQVPSAPNAVLFLWAVHRLLPEAFQVMEAWGFSYRDDIVWVKPSIGLGIWVRHRHELLFVGIKGDWPAPEPIQRPDSVIEAPRRRHSQKPDEVYEQLERMYPQARKLELFARTARDGWSAWGNEAPPS